MESAVACRAAPEQGRDVFVNKTPLYKPLWGRGAFGGAVLAQALSAAQATVPAGFVADTMHCHFFRAVQTHAPLYAHVERVREGASIATRAVRCLQAAGGTAFAAMINFGRAAGRGPRMLQHQPASPVSPAALAAITSGGPRASTSAVDADCPFESMRVRGRKDDAEERPERQRIVQLTRAKLPPGAADDAALQLAALAYMTDNYFLGTVPRVHKARRFSNRNLVSGVVAKLDEGHREAATERFQVLAEEELADAASRGGQGGVKKAPPPRIEMMVSLDHTIFFHNQEAVKADEWMVMEMETPWAGQDRGLVLERIWTAGGVLVATCIQEGLFRLSQDAESHL
ncbi:Acyl-thioesterase [Cordyceps militaris]|uniref:Acyl-thioesterase n=1 Tax=Cordyceps militaris TaxID=73501 RepID=A0A2H4SW60_CORMI|nr:Acyl-thioesterase [Cordyceps militaris]